MNAVFIDVACPLLVFLAIIFNTGLTLGLTAALAETHMDRLEPLLLPSTVSAEEYVFSEASRLRSWLHALHVQQMTTLH